MTALPQRAPAPRLLPCAKCKATFFAEQLNAQGKCSGCGSNKYHAKKVTIAGRRYDSQHEAEVVEPLFWRERQGEISNLRRQVPFALIVNGVKVATYKADAVYEEDGKQIVLDAKGMKTQVYTLKKKLMLACHGISIIEL
jgi:Protein of unknown function (DUF1064)